MESVWTVHSLQIETQTSPQLGNSVQNVCDWNGSKGIPFSVLVECVFNFGVNCLVDDKETIMVIWTFVDCVPATVPSAYR